MSESKQAKDKGGKEIYPVLPLRDIVVFPYMIVPLFVGREKSINALEEVMRADKQILLAAQKNAGDDDPAPDAIYQMGTLASVLQLLKLPDGTVKVLVEGTARAKVVRYTENPDYFEAEVERVVEGLGASDEIEALARGAGHHQPDRGLLQARRYHRFASRHQDRRQAGHPRDHHGLEPARARLHADGERDLRDAGREEDPLAREAADGEDPARVLLE